ncbi:MAG: hypothetical protein ABSB41_19630 [Anaerolineales bacterium]|jgi:hypothetical protein
MGSIKRQLSKYTPILVGSFILLIATSACGSAATPTSVATTLPPVASTMDLIETQEYQTIESSIAYNAPNTMQKDTPVTIELLLNPSLSSATMAAQVTGTGPVITTGIEITPITKAVLTSPDKDAFTILSIDSPEQVVSSTETTKWRWFVTPKKGGLQLLILTIYRQVHLQDQDYWPEVATYTSSIDVNVTWVQWITSQDWEWVFGSGGFVALLLAIYIGLVKPWIDNRNRPKHAKS